MLSRRRRNDSPQHPTLLLTTLPHATAPLTVALYVRRWPVELCIKGLKGMVGLGHHQVTQDATRVERAVAIAVMAYLLLLRLRARQIQPGSSWSGLRLSKGWPGSGARANCTARSDKKPERRSVGTGRLNRPPCGWLRKSISHPVNFE